MFTECLPHSWKDYTYNWDEDELLELVVSQFGERKASYSTEVKPANRDAKRRDLVIAER